MIGILVIVVMLALYFLPSYVAYRTKHKDQVAILALNLLAGWTLVGWIISFVWALKKPSVG